MVDRWAFGVIHPPLNHIAESLVPRWLLANTVTLLGFAIGLLAIPLLWMQWYHAALIVILVNRLLDGLDGAIARNHGITDLGGYLDITCDFIFYSAVVFGFALADPSMNGVAAAFLIFSFVGTGSSFLSFAIFATKRDLNTESHGRKAFYYLGGLTEGTETLMFFVAVCLFPDHFVWLATGFGVLCWITTLGRIGIAFQTFRH